MLLFAIFAVFANHFFTVRSLLSLLLQTSTFIILSIGSALVLIVGGIDFSLGAEIAFSGTAVFVLAGFGVPIWLAMILAIGLGGLIGLINGFLVARMRLQSFIATLGMATLLYGILGGLGDFIRSLAALSPRPLSFINPEALGDLANKPVFVIVSHDASGTPIEVFPGISWIVIIMVLVTLFFHFVLTKTSIGRHLYLVGANPVAARLSGVSVVRIRSLAFVLAGLLAGLTGVLLASRLVGPPGGAVGYEILGIACAMIGGASLLGGSGSVAGTVIGAFIISTLSMGLTMMNTNNAYISLLLNGFIILGAVYLEQSRKR